MKKFFLFAALACTVFASCQKEAPVASVQNDGQQEITFTALSKGLTKSVLGSGSSFDTNGPGTGKRTIIAAGAMKNSAGSWVDFLEPTNFNQDGNSGKWVANPKVYYPLGGDGDNFKFLAYSETAIPAAGSTRKPVTARWYGSTEVEINIDEKCDTNDVVYAGFKGVKQNVATPLFKHSQALVTVYIRTNQDTIKINKIGFEDVKTSGTLSLKRDLKNATDETAVTVNWLFNSGCNCHFAEMGNYYLDGCSTITAPTVAGNAGTASFEDEIEENTENFFKAYEKNDAAKIGDTNEYGNVGLGTWINSTGCVFDRLFPAQELETKTIVINYTLGDITADARLTFENPGTGDPKVYTWGAGTRYVYDITVKPAEIVLDPSVENAWELKIITGDYK